MAHGDFLSAHGNVYVGKGRHACKGKIHYAWSYYLFLLSSANRILNLQRLLHSGLCMGTGMCGLHDKTGSCKLCQDKLWNRLLCQYGYLQVTCFRLYWGKYFCCLSPYEEGNTPCQT